MKPWPSSGLAFLALACGAVFPEVVSPIKAPPSGRALEPAPPRDLVFIAFADAEIPPRTRDGRQWDTIGGSAPDPFAKLIVDDKEVIRTPVQANTLKPTWPDQKRANYRFAPGARFAIELWDSNALNNHPICVKKLHELLEQVGPAPIDVACDSGAHVRLRVEPAHARWGLGFSYELRTIGAGITSVFRESPAARAGLRVGDDIVEIQGKKVAKMEEGEVQSKINADAQIGIGMLVRGSDGAERRISIKEGVIYPSVDEDVPVD